MLTKIYVVSLFIKLSTCSLVINTWNFQDAAKEAWQYIRIGYSSIDAIEAGCKVCETLQCDFTVGYGGSPDEAGETTLDAMIFDGKTMDMGAVGALRRIKSAISVAKHVLQNTQHSFLAGDQATAFAVEMGFKEESLSTGASENMWEEWKANKCQPNSWKNVEPDSRESCGPYQPLSENSVMFNYLSGNTKIDARMNHDTIGMIALDKNNNIAAGTSTNGLRNKIPGRVGDSPIPGAGAYADNNVGAACATGDGDVMMRFLPSFLAVEEMRRGRTPEEAARIAVDRITSKYPNFSGAVIAVNMKEQYGAACNLLSEFPYSIANDVTGKVIIEAVPCTNPP